MSDAPRPRLKAATLADLAALILTAADLGALSIQPGDLERLALAAEPASRSRTRNRLHPPRTPKGRTIND